MILVRNQIKNKLGGGTENFTFRKIKIKNQDIEKKGIPLVYSVVVQTVQCSGADCTV
jgi:hypothetical protein